MGKRIERLTGPSTHVCWTPDNVPQAEREIVVLVREKDLKALEAQVPFESQRLDIVIKGPTASGKTTMMHELGAFLKRRGFKVKCIDDQWERAPHQDSGYTQIDEGSVVVIVTELTEKR